MHLRISRGKFTGTLHSAFFRVINIRDDANGELFSISLPEIGNSQNGLLVENLPLIQNGEPPSHFKTIGSHLLVVGTEFIDLSEARVWEPLKPTAYLDKECISGNFGVLLHEVKKHEKCPLHLSGNLLTATARDKVYGIIIDSLPVLYKAVGSQDVSLLKEVAHRIVGLGQGLTPSGDDFMTGFMTGLLRGYTATNWKRDGLLSCVKVLINESRTLTNLISYTQLVMAGNGDESEKVNNLMNLLYCYNDKNKLVACIHDVLRIGHTSGMDLLIGIFSSADFMLWVAGGEKVVIS